MLTLDQIRVHEGDFTLDADFKIETGGVIAILGPSGGGKSTLLSAIAGFLDLQAGRVLWNEQDLTEKAPGKRPIAMIFQDNNLFPHLTALQNVLVGVTTAPRPSAGDVQLAETAMARVGLEGKGLRKPSALSGGQQSRVALARSLLTKRPVLLMDEPFAALGPALKSEMLTLVADLARGTGITVLMVTHDPADAKMIADRSILVVDGVVHPPRATDELFQNPPEALSDYLGQA